MRRHVAQLCGICDRATPTVQGGAKVWYYEPRADFYCARHWEAAFAEDCRDHRDDTHWRTVTLPLLEFTLHDVRREAAVAV